jgi:hypothetical protein
LGSTSEQRLKALEYKFVVITILFQKYERMFGELLQLPTATDRAHRSVFYPSMFKMIGILIRL